MRRAQTTVEYLLTISVITIAIMSVVYGMTSTMYDGTNVLANQLATNLTSDSVQ